jgi:hypothetical protein
MNTEITTTDKSTTNEPSSVPTCYKTDMSYKRITALSAEQKIAIHLLLAGQSDQQVAAVAGVHRTTIARWRIYHPLFQTELNRQRQALWHNQADRLRSMLAPALDLLQSHLASPSERSSFRAAVSLIRLAIKLGAPSGPTDEYQLLKEYYLADHREQQRYGQETHWPVPKEYLDDLRVYLHKKSADIPIAIDKDCAEIQLDAGREARFYERQAKNNP